MAMQCEKKKYLGKITQVLLLGIECEMTMGKLCEDVNR